LLRTAIHENKVILILFLISTEDNSLTEELPEEIKLETVTEQPTQVSEEVTKESTDPVMVEEKTTPESTAGSCNAQWLCDYILFSYRVSVVEAWSSQPCFDQGIS